MNEEEKQLIKKKYSSKRFKIWKWNHTVIVYDRKTKTKRSLNKEIKEHRIVSEHKHKGSLHSKEVPKSKITQRKSNVAILHYSHLFACECIVKFSEKYKIDELPKHISHYHYYTSRSAIPRYEKAKKSHNHHYPDHNLLSIEYKLTKEPTH